MAAFALDILVGLVLHLVPTRRSGDGVAVIAHRVAGVAFVGGGAVARECSVGLGMMRLEPIGLV